MAVYKINESPFPDRQTDFYYKDHPGRLVDSEYLYSYKGYPIILKDDGYYTYLHGKYSVSRNSSKEVEAFIDANEAVSSSSNLKESLWDSSRVQDLYSYYFNKYGYLDDDKCKALIKKQMEKEGSILPHTDEEFDRAFRSAQEREEEIANMYDESLKESFSKFGSPTDLQTFIDQFDPTGQGSKSAYLKTVSAMIKKYNCTRDEAKAVLADWFSWEDPDSLKESVADPREYDLQDLGLSPEEEEKVLGEARDSLSKLIKGLGCDPDVSSQYSRWNRAVEDIAYLVASYRKNYDV